MKSFKRYIVEQDTEEPRETWRIQLIKKIYDLTSVVPFNFVWKYSEEEWGKAPFKHAIEQYNPRSGLLVATRDVSEPVDGSSQDFSLIIFDTDRVKIDIPLLSREGRGSIYGEYPGGIFDNILNRPIFITGSIVFYLQDNDEQSDMDVTRASTHFKIYNYFCSLENQHKSKKLIQTVDFAKDFLKKDGAWHQKDEEELFIIKKKLYPEMLTKRDYINRAMLDL